jgi:hypothetical protein
VPDNRHEAERAFGARHVADKVAERRRARTRRNAAARAEKERRRALAEARAARQRVRTQEVIAAQAPEQAGPAPEEALPWLCDLGIPGGAGASIRTGDGVEVR